MDKIYKVAIIGGGASGIFSAILLSEKLHGEVILLERTDRVGKKITATGNGRGNVTNENLSADNYHSKEGDAQSFVRYALTVFDNESVKSFISSIGGLTVAEKGRVYPASLQASSLLDLMRLRLNENGAEVRTDFCVTQVKKGKFFTVVSDKGQTVLAENVIMCCGGKCQKQFGTDGTAYALAKSLGHTVTDCLPALVQLKTETSQIKTLKGIRQEVFLTLLDGDMVKTCEKGDLLFTEFGVSGNAVFQLSGFAVSAKRPVLSVEFMPEFSEFDLISALCRKLKNAPYLTAEDLLTGYVNKQLGRAIVRASGVNLSEKCAKSHVNTVVRCLKEFRLPVLGTLGFNYAQVTRGGVRLYECDSKTFESKKVEGLFITGEMLDVDGDCGGYNLQWAFSSAYVACQTIAKKFNVDIPKFERRVK